MIRSQITKNNVSTRLVKDEKEGAYINVRYNEIRQDKTRQDKTRQDKTRQDKIR
jgi:hypothetical protein